MPTFVYPSNSELKQVEQVKLPVLTAADPIFSILPMVDVDSHILSWEQQDNYQGLQQVRGLNGQPGKVKKVGGKRYLVEPGVYGEFKTIDELELTTRRQWGTFNAPINISDLVMESQDHLLNRRLDRIRYIGWTLLTTGTFSVSNADGSITHTDTFPLQTYTAGTLWSTTATATPIANLRAIKLLGRGKSVSFGSGARLFMNQTDVNNLLNNTNANDLFGRRVAGLTTINSLSVLNQILMGDDLPQIEVYDEGYEDETGTFQLFIPAGKATLVGRRTNGAAIGDYAMTRNANNPNLEAGAYTKVTDNSDEDVPRMIGVHDGHNGGPRLYFPSAIVALNI